MEKILKINLSEKTVKSDHIPQDWVREYIGGSGLAARLLWERLSADLDALDPASPLVLASGPFTGTSAPTPGKYTLCARSPQTGLWGESNLGGHTGPALRRSGYDVLWIEGRSDEPVSIWLHDGEVEILPAGHLWGKSDTYETQTVIRKEISLPDAKIAAIGRAGENRLPFASIMADDGRAAGRTGMGAVMGSKNLKALAFSGKRRPHLADPQAFQKQAKRMNQELLDHNLTAIFKELGTSGALDYLQILGDMPQKYWTEAVFSESEKISGTRMAETILTGNRACFGCVIGCGRQVHIKEGKYRTPPNSKGPEYETICALGSQLMINDLPAITRLGEICDRLGMDTISVGNILGLAFLLFERGIITEKETGGIELEWGNPESVEKLLYQTADRQGIGAYLAQGSQAFADQFGQPNLAVQINGLEVPMHDPRAFFGQALVYITSPRGACHNQSDYFNVDMGGAIEEIGVLMGDRFVEQGKAPSVMRHQHWRSVCNSLVTCFFASVKPAEIAELLSSATGMDWDLAELMKTGERIWNLKRMINIKLGLTREKEKLPHLLQQPLPESGQEGHVPNMDILLREYNQASSWDEVSGMPVMEKLEELNLNHLLST